MPHGSLYQTESFLTDIKFSLQVTYIAFEMWSMDMVQSQDYFHNLFDPYR